MSSISDKKMLISKLESNYLLYNDLKWLNPDPLGLVLPYKSREDRVAAGLVTACLSYGRASLIMKAVEKVLLPMGQHPADWIAQRHWENPSYLPGFRYRFTTEEHIKGLLSGISSLMASHGTLSEAFFSCCHPADASIIPALKSFTDSLRLQSGRDLKHILPDPSSSISKRLHMFLRWMVRCDAIDPGCWSPEISPRLLMIPLDTHMFRISCHLGLTSRKSADYKSFIEVSDQFRLLNREDPVKYDFSLTRLGIHPDLQISLIDQQQGRVLPG